MLAIRHCQAYECLMNGSSQLKEADQKPFALCPVCLKKLGFYLGFEGEELARYQELKKAFELMNHNDGEQNFTREISVFTKIITRLQEQPALVNNVTSQSYLSNIKEGGYIEQASQNKMLGNQTNLLPVFHQQSVTQT